MDNISSHDVIISGGGMVGMSLAIGLSRQGARVMLLDKIALPSQLDASFDGRVSAVARGSKFILESIGVWEGIMPYAEPIKDIRVSDGASPIFLHYDHKEVGSDPFGYIVENRYIRHALHIAADTSDNLTIIDGCEISHFEYDASNVVLHTKTHGEFSCRLLIGADGKHSKIRELAGIKTTQWAYKQTAIVATIEHENLHNGLAQERFLPAGPFAVLPMQNNRSSLVWVEPDDRVAIYMELSEEEFVQEITERVGDYLGTLRSVGKRFTYPLSLMHAEEYTKTRIAIIGDAAHSMHPIAGQGVNLGFRDVAVLLELIAKQQSCGMDIGSDEMLNHYARWRRFDNVAMLAATDILNRLFTNNILQVKLARDMGLWGVGKLPRLKSLFMRHAMGLVGDLPKSVAKHKN